MRAAPLRTSLVAVALSVCGPSQAQSGPPQTCAAFLGSWAGTWSQGSYGTNWIHVTAVSADCVAQVAYSPWETAPTSTAAIPVREGVMEFVCHRGTGGTCRMELEGQELRVRYSDPTGFVNEGSFRKRH